MAMITITAVGSYICTALYRRCALLLQLAVVQIVLAADDASKK